MARGRPKKETESTENQALEKEGEATVESTAKPQAKPEPKVVEKVVSPLSDEEKVELRELSNFLKQFRRNNQNARERTKLGRAIELVNKVCK